MSVITVPQDTILRLYRQNVIDGKLMKCTHRRVNQLNNYMISVYGLTFKKYLQARSNFLQHDVRRDLDENIKREEDGDCMVELKSMHPKVGF